MQNALTLWTDLGRRRQVILLFAVAALVAALVALLRMASTPSQSLLYAGLEPAAAGEVVRALDQKGETYEVRGDSIWVSSDRRDQLRMALAGEGLPATGGSGYELLDQLTGFGTTAQMFDAAWLRAKEGELARTIAASPQIRAARVHLALPVSQPFRRESGATAAVTVTTVSGSVSAAQAQAIRHLVASAVAGLQPAQVSVIDSVVGLVGQEETGLNRPAEARSEEIRRAVERLLAARVGQGRALVEVSVDLITDQESIRERRLDPESRIVISTDTENRTGSASGAPPGVTVASNLPEGDGAAGQGAQSQEAQSRERINYEISETAREVVRSPGGIRRLSVAVLVDGLRGADGTWQARSDAELTDLRDLVASAVGFDAERGDVITLKSLEFEALSPGEAAIIPGLFAGLDVMALIQMAIVAVVLLALALLVVRPLLKMPSHLPAPVPALPPQSALTSALTLPDPAVTLPGLTGTGDSDPAADPVARLRALITERQSESVEILRSWMEEREETH